MDKFGARGLRSGQTGRRDSWKEPVGTAAARAGAGIVHRPLPLPVRVGVRVGLGCLVPLCHGRWPQRCRPGSLTAADGRQWAAGSPISRQWTVPTQTGLSAAGTARHDTQRQPNTERAVTTVGGRTRTRSAAGAATGPGPAAGAAGPGPPAGGRTRTRSAAGAAAGPGPTARRRDQDQLPAAGPGPRPTASSRTRTRTTGRRGGRIMITGRRRAAAGPDRHTSAEPVPAIGRHPMALPLSSTACSAGAGRAASSGRLNWRAAAACSPAADPGDGSGSESHRLRIHEQQNSKVSNGKIRYVKQTEILTRATHVNG